MKFSLLDKQHGVDMDILSSYESYASRRSSASLEHSARPRKGGDGKEVGEGAESRHLHPWLQQVCDVALPEGDDATYVSHMQRAEAGGRSLRGELVGDLSPLSSWVKSAADKLAAGLSSGGELRGPGGHNPSAGFIDVTGSERIGISSPAYSPIFACSSLSELAQIVERTPENRLQDLVLMQTGLVRSLVVNRLEHRRFRELNHLHTTPPAAYRRAPKQDRAKYKVFRTRTGQEQTQPPCLLLKHASLPYNLLPLLLLDYQHTHFHAKDEVVIIMLRFHPRVAPLGLLPLSCLFPLLHPLPAGNSKAPLLPAANGSMDGDAQDSGLSS